MPRRTRLYSILYNKCPRCYEGNFFIGNNPFQLKKFDKMHERCPHCGESFVREPGFYFGSMYVSYGLTIALGVGVFLLTYFVLRLTLMEFLVVFTVLALLLMPWIYRKARLIWINLFVGPKATKDLKEKEHMASSKKQQ